MHVSKLCPNIMAAKRISCPAKTTGLTVQGSWQVIPVQPVESSGVHTDPNITWGHSFNQAGQQIIIGIGNFDLPCTNETKLWEKGTMWYFLVKTPRWFACSVNFETHFRLCLPSKTGHFHSILLLYFENKAKAAAWRISIWETYFKFLIKKRLFGSCNR